MHPRVCVRTLRAHSGPVNTVQFNSDGNYCLSCGQDGTLRLWNPYQPAVPGSSTGALLVATYAGMHQKGALGSAIFSDNSRFVSCGNDNSALLWDVKSRQVIRKFWDHTGRVNCVALNSRTQGEESVLVTGSYDTLVRAFDLRSRNPRPIQTLDAGRDSITSLIVTDHKIIAGDVNGLVNQYDLRKGCIVSDKFQAPVSSIALSRDENCLLVSCLDSTLQLLEAKTGEHMMSYKGHTARNFSIGCCFSNTDAYVFSGSEDSQVCVWDLVEAKVITRLGGHTDAVTSVVHHPKRNACALSSSHDGTIKLWDVEKR